VYLIFVNFASAYSITKKVTIIKHSGSWEWLLVGVVLMNDHTIDVKP